MAAQVTKEELDKLEATTTKLEWARRAER